MAKAYYNENDPRAAAWLRALIWDGLIADGDVDERSIEDVRAAELAGYAQCHFFAGIGGWSYALRLAGWPDDKPVWTGSCPCQPFSAAGKGKGFADERHLWPSWFHLIRIARPAIVFGEQVASPAGLAWFDLVSTDMEAALYSIAASDLCAAGVGAPHIRQRLYWVAHHHHLGRVEHAQRDSSSVGGREEGARGDDVGGRGEHGVADPQSEQPHGSGYSRRGRRESSVDSDTRELADNSSSTGLEIEREQQARRERETAERSRSPWHTHEWVSCRDGKSRPVEPGSFPLAHGVPGRVGLLRGYGNAIVPQVAAAFIGAYMDVAQSKLRVDR